MNKNYLIVLLVCLTVRMYGMQESPRRAQAPETASWFWHGGVSTQDPVEKSLALSIDLYIRTRAKSGYVSRIDVDHFFANITDDQIALLNKVDDGMRNGHVVQLDRQETVIFQTLPRFVQRLFGQNITLYKGR